MKFAEGMNMLKDNKTQTIQPGGLVDETAVDVYSHIVVTGLCSGGME